MFCLWGAWGREWKYISLNAYFLSYIFFFLNTQINNQNFVLNGNKLSYKRYSLSQDCFACDSPVLSRLRWQDGL